MMKKSIVAALMALCLLVAAGASAENVVIRNADGTIRMLPGAKSGRVVVTAEEEAEAEAEEAEEQPQETAKEKAAREKAERAEAAEAAGFDLTTEYRWFVSQYGAVRGRTVTYYDNVYAYNHGDYYLTPFDSKVSPEFLTIDESGAYAVAPIVLDITDAMRVRLYGEDVGEVSMLYGQYCERIVGRKGNEGFSGVHEGVDFTSEQGAPLHVILGGEVTRAGDRNGTVAVYSEEYDMTVLYLHCYDICVRRGDVIEAGDQIGEEGKKGIKGYTTYYTHVEVREGRHTTSNPYRNTILESACPYPLMLEALDIKESGRQPVTAAAVMEAERMRAEAEAAALAAAEAEAKAAEKEAEPEIELIDTLPGTDTSYGFKEVEAAPEATLPPSK